MTKDLSVESIEVKVDVKELATLIGDVCSSSYGVLGLASTKKTSNMFDILLKKDKYIEGILIKKERNKYVVDVHVVVAYGVKITEVVNELGKRLSYNLNKTYGKVFGKINIYVEELRDL